jgi:uncharacterized protein YcaQ
MAYIYVDKEKKEASLHGTVSGLCAKHGLVAETVRAGLRRGNGWWESRSGKVVAAVDKEVNKKLVRSRSGFAKGKKK